MRKILGALDHLTRSRPGFEPANYVGAPDAYRQDSRRAQRDRRDALQLIQACEIRSVPEALIIESLTSRLTWDGEALDFTACQYYPTEYRAAVCRSLASALWAHWRDGGSQDVRATARRELGPSLAKRWFA